MYRREETKTEKHYLRICMKEGEGCPKCGSTAVRIDGDLYNYTKGGLVRVVCMICGMNEFFDRLGRPWLRNTYLPDVEEQDYYQKYKKGA